MIPEPGSRRPGAVMWGSIGVTLLVLAAVTGFRLDSRVTGYATATLVLVCLVVCGATFWLDSHAARERARLRIRVRCGSSGTTSKTKPTGMPVRSGRGAQGEHHHTGRWARSTPPHEGRAVHQ